MRYISQTRVHIFREPSQVHRISFFLNPIYIPPEVLPSAIASAMTKTSSSGGARPSKEETTHLNCSVRIHLYPSASFALPFPPCNNTPATDRTLHNVAVSQPKSTYSGSTNRSSSAHPDSRVAQSWP